MAPRIREGEYGPVLVVRGEYEGQVGYDDDDEGNLAIVYFAEPFESDYVLIRRSWLRKTTVTPIELARWKRKYPGIAKRFNVP